METVIKERSVQRRLFSMEANKLEEYIDRTTQAEKNMIKAAWIALADRRESLQRSNEEIKKKIIADPDFDEEFYEKELQRQLEYEMRWLVVNEKYNLAFSVHTEQSNPEMEPKQKIRLPKLELTKFDGDIKNWLPFWGQFENIHKDKLMEKTDKFQYLIQATIPGSDARILIDAYPCSAENYDKCVEHLKTRYGREDLLIQYYVRQLLALISQKSCLELVTLYDKLSAQLRALESLGVTKNHATFILPMVESVLPQEVLRTWERSTTHESKMDEELSKLMKFLEKEVECEQRIKMAGSTHKQEIGTASCLASTSKVSNDNKSLKKQNDLKCIWCDKDGHTSSECYRIYKMTVEDRAQKVKEKKACENCLKTGHRNRFCRAFIKCLICGKRHNTLLCKSLNVEKIVEDSTATAATACKGTTLLQTVVVEIVNGKSRIRARALIDSGSQKTYIKEDIAKKLALKPIKKEKLSYCLFGGVKTDCQEHSVYELQLKNLEGDFALEVEALGQTNLCRNVPKANTNDAKLSLLLREHNIELTERPSTSNEIEILIGADYSGLIFTGIYTQLENGLTAIKTKFGWTLQGQHGSSVSNLSLVFFNTDDNNVSDYWDLETLGIRDSITVKSSEEKTAEVMQFFKETVSNNEEGRYVVQLPFKSGFEELLPNYGRAKQRLEGITKKLMACNKFDDYSAVFQEWLAMGIIESVPENEINPGEGHFLPHRAVIKESSLTTSIRPVFDASATDRRGLSLNACLEKGINLIDLIPNLLIGFRRGAIGLSADIAKAFLQISLIPGNRKYLKFLWWEDETLQKLIVYRHCRVVFGLTCSPFLLSATLQHHLESVSGAYRDTAQLLIKSFYVDNCLVSLDSEDEARNFIDEAKNIMELGKFNLRMWVTSPLQINEAGKEVISVLGLNWDTSKDELYCNTANLPAHEDLNKVTKRDLLSITQRIFDPIGYTAPVVLYPKLIIQETWIRQLPWDSLIPSDLLDKFKEWYQYITYLDSCRLPRRLSFDILSKCEVSLHLMCDASKYGMGACVFIRAEKDGDVSVQLVSAKARVTPPQKATIPRLELTAALIGSRLLTHTRKYVGLPNVPEYCWIDSGVALCWIKRELPFKTFVGNRITEIRQNTDIKSWRHIPGEQNWADLASRGCNAKELFECRWWEGPLWLRQQPEFWPRSELVVDEREVSLETKQTVCSKHIYTEVSLLDKIQGYFSKYTKIVRMMAWLLRFTYNASHPTNKKVGEITFKEFDKAEKTVIRLIQRENVDLIQQKTTNLVQFEDKEGLVRVKTKLLLSDFPEHTKTPFLLPAKNAVVIAMVKQRHLQLHHAGANQLIADIRVRFWIIGIRRLVKSVISGCVICKRHRSYPVQAPAAPLPPERTECGAPFQTTGVDLAGPLYLKDGGKCWIVLYTCAVYRAVHLELAKSLSTEAFLMTLRRFVARRGRSHTLMSDHGTNFQGTKNLLSSLDWEEVMRVSSIRRITWRMNAPTAAWWGGYWERLIRIMKDLLRRVLGNASVTYDELETLLCDCEATMNSRPLTYVSDDKGEGLEPLTPAHFIQPIPDVDVADFDLIDAKSMNCRLRFLHNLRSQFRQRFKVEYLTQLVQKGKESKDMLEVGDVVLIETEEKRSKWPLGRVEETFTGKDGVQRTARVKTVLGSKIRPFQRLYKLEVSSGNIPSPILTPKLVSGADSGIHKPDNNDPSCSHQLPPRSTRCGRVVRMPSRFNNNMYDLVSLAFAGSIGMTFIILACALPQYNKAWWPFFVVLFYLLCPIPTMIARHQTDSSGGTNSPCMEVAIFITMGIIISSFGLPIVLARAGTILAGACYLTLVGNLIVYLTILGFFTIFDMEDSDYAMW